MNPPRDAHPSCALRSVIAGMITLASTPRHSYFPVFYEGCGGSGLARR